MFELQNGQKVIQTSPHGAKFSDGTIFKPSVEEVEEIKTTWVKTLNVNRQFERVDGFLVPTTKSTQSLSEEGVAALEHYKDKDVLILVSFMVLAALKEMGIRDKFPYVVGMNATRETARSAPQDKVIDVENFAH
jgi:aspartate 1-decarboxylase